MVGVGEHQAHLGVPDDAHAARHEVLPAVGRRRGHGDGAGVEAADEALDKGPALGLEHQHPLPDTVVGLDPGRDPAGRTVQAAVRQRLRHLAFTGLTQEHQGGPVAEFGRT
jgi:hypothetical protein